jgi:hypothetical protein
MLMQIAEYLSKVLDGMEQGISRVANALPVLVRQEVTAKANQKLDSTRDDYLNALKTHYSQSVLVVELDADNWIANAVETGRTAWDMRSTHLKSPKTKISRMGYRYMHIPVPQTKTGTKTKTQAGMELQDKIREALKRPSFAPPKAQTRRDGTVAVSEAIMSADPEVQGLHRIRRYADSEAWKSGGRPLSSQFVLFRTMSENPASRSQWAHPGIRAANIFQDVQRWSDTILPMIVEKIIDDAILESLK